MKKKTRVILALVLGAVALIVMVGGYFWYQMGEALYQPGMVRAEKNLRGSLTPPPQSGDPDFWNVEPDIRLHHFSQGAGRNVLIVHGGPGYPDVKPWSSLDALANKFAFRYYDQRGCGQSTRPFDRFSSGNYYENMTTLEQTLGLGAQVADIERIRQILGEDKLIFIGHSWGGFLASLYAAEFPEHVQALILVAPADMLVMPQEGGGLYEDVRKRLPAAMQADYDAYLKRYFDFGSIFSQSDADLVALNDEFVKYYAAAAGTPLSVQGKTGGWMVQAMYFSIGTRHDYRAALKAVNAPVLVVYGANDLQTEKASRAYVAAFPNATFQVIGNADHFVFDDQPDKFAAVVDEFLDNLPRD